MNYIFLPHTITNKLIATSIIFLNQKYIIRKNNSNKHFINEVQVPSNIG